jgi:hypothetical protein
LLSLKIISTMKKVLFIFGFLFSLSIAAVNAQSCHGSTAATGEGKACCAGKVAKAASADPSIEKRVSDTGEVAYVRKETDQQGSVKFVSVKFDEGTSTFVNVAPKTLTADAKTGMVKKEGKACVAGEGKACCKGGAAATEGKACCKGGVAKTDANQ